VCEEQARGVRGSAVRAAGGGRAARVGCVMRSE